MASNADLFGDNEPHSTHRHGSPSVPSPAAPIRVYGACGRQWDQPLQEEPGGDASETFETEPGVDLIRTKNYSNVSKIAE